MADYSLAGQVVRRPTSAPMDLDPVTTETELAGGRLVRYDRGRRARWRLSWQRLPDAARAPLQAAASARGSIMFVDGATGQSHRVFVRDPSFVPVAGTDPVRWSCSMELVTVRPV